MNRRLFYFLSIVCLFVCFSCDEEKKTETADVSYKFFNFENAGWRSRTSIHQLSGISYKATMVPIQYYILRNMGIENSQKADSIYEQLKTERIIEMEFQHVSEEDLLKEKYTNLDYQSAVKHMAFGIEKDLTVVTSSRDTIRCSGVTFERNFKLAPYKRILLHFDNIPEEEKIQLVYQDQLFGNGILKFRFKEAPIKL